MLRVQKSLAPSMREIRKFEALSGNKMGNVRHIMGICAQLVAHCEEEAFIQCIVSAAKDIPQARHE
jgi:hypothetical protein